MCDMESKKRKNLLIVFALMAISLLLAGCTTDPNMSVPGLTLSMNQNGSPTEVTSGVQLLVLLTVLSLAPSIIILATSFTRIVIVLSMLRNAIGTPAIPPNQVIIGLSLILTFYIMAPVYQQIDQNAIKPYEQNQIDQQTAITRGLAPVRDFMFKQTREKDIQLFVDLGKEPQPASLDDIKMTTLLPAFVISELRVAFIMGFVIYIPFLIIDMVISSLLLSMGMMMLPPSLVSLPFKLLLFISVDGWYLITRSLVLSFGGS